MKNQKAAKTNKTNKTNKIKPAKPAPKVAPSTAWKSILLKNRQGVMPCLANVVAILAHEPAWAGVFAFDEFTHQAIKLKSPPWHDDYRPKGDLRGPWDEEDASRAATWISREWEATPSPQVVDQAVMVIAHQNPTHPVRDWLEGLKWDRKPRVDTWLVRCAGAEDTPYVRAVSSMFMIGAVARVMKPGCKVDHTLVLEAKTGVGKSTLLKDLVGSEWFLETEMDLGSKDFFQALRGKWILELAELDSLSRGELSRVKAVLTKTVDSYRQSYGKRSKDYPRQCVFTGTTEEEAYLKDEKGNRRFWPVPITRVTAGAVARERAQLWAEAVERYRQGEKWHLTDRTMMGLFEREQEQRRQLDPWEGAIAAFLHGSRFVSRGVETGDILEQLRIPVRERTRAEEMRVGAILRKLGWARGRERIAGVQEYIYRPLDELAWRARKPAAAPELSEVVKRHREAVAKRTVKEKTPRPEAPALSLSRAETVTDITKRLGGAKSAKHL